MWMVEGNKRYLHHFNGLAHFLGFALSYFEEGGTLRIERGPDFRYVITKEN